MGRKALMYVLVGAATVTLSQLLAAWRSWLAVPTTSEGVVGIFLSLTLLGIMGWLGFILYEADREAGEVKRRIGLYEWMLARCAKRGRGAPGKAN